MRLPHFVLCAALCLASASGLAADAGSAKPSPALAGDPAYVKSVKDWRAKAEESLRRDNGWLTLAGRYPLKMGENTFGTGPKNDVVFPPGLGPVHMGIVDVQPGKVVVKMVEGLQLDK